MIIIKSVFTPFALSLNRKKVELKIIIENKDDEEKIVSLDVLMPKVFSLQKGPSSVFHKKLGSLKKGGKKVLYIEIEAKPFAEIRNYHGLIKVYEHYNDYSFIEKEYKKELTLRVIR